MSVGVGVSTLRKMTVAHDHPVRYYFQEKVLLNDFLGKKITLHFTGNIACTHCHRKITKTFQQGYCYPCMQRILECNNCMIYPEKCLVETGACPTDDWAHEQCHQKHILYLANSSGLKVGITRIANMPSRWIDQGAIQALPIAETENRYQVGLLEMALRKVVADKTNWRVMLKNNVTPIDLVAEKKRILSLVTIEIKKLLTQYPDAIRVLDTENVLTFHYPVLQYPEKIVSLSFDKTPEITGKLLGIKAQYLILDCGVLNLRKFGGYEVFLK